MAVDFWTEITYVAPLAVSIFAVWLGFYYQRQLADREKLRSAYIEVFLGLGRMLDALELLEGLKYADWLLGFQRQPDGSPRPDHIEESADRFRNLSNRLGFFTDTTEGPIPMRDGRYAVEGASPVRLAQMANERYNRAQTDVREANLGLILGAPALYSAPGLIRANAVIGRIQDEIALTLQGLTEKDPVPVDWDRLAGLSVLAQTIVHRVLGGSKTGTAAVLQYREKFPWPAELLAKMRTNASLGDTMTPFEGPSFLAWREKSPRIRFHWSKRHGAPGAPKEPKN